MNGFGTRFSQYIQRRSIGNQGDTGIEGATGSVGPVGLAGSMASGAPTGPTGSSLVETVFANTLTGTVAFDHVFSPGVYRLVFSFIPNGVGQLSMQLSTTIGAPFLSSGYRSSYHYFLWNSTTISNIPTTSDIRVTGFNSINAIGRVQTTSMYIIINELGGQAYVISSSIRSNPLTFIPASDFTTTSSVRSVRLRIVTTDTSITTQMTGSFYLYKLIG
jgi:hypothetical protein